DGVGAIGQDRRQRDAEVERKGYVVANDLAVEQELHVADLHVVGNRGIQDKSRSLLDLGAWRYRIEIGEARTDRDRWSLSLIVEGAVVDDLQIVRPVGDEGDTGAEGNALRIGGKSELSKERCGVSRVGNVQYLNQVPVAAGASHRDGE